MVMTQQHQMDKAWWECFIKARPHCIFNHPLFKGERFELNTPAAHTLENLGMHRMYRRKS